MKKVIKLLTSLILFAAIFLLPSCDNEAPKLDPKKTILGKWEETYYGSDDNNLFAIEDPIVSIEFLPDSVIEYYNYEYQTFSYQKYWFEDPLFIKSFEVYDNVTNETIEIKFPFKYEFINRNKIKLEIQISAQWTITILERID